ncbi:MAG: PASTA domain-containing protein [Oscillospiraceae bacterium]|nr:PASTA domain-containing protein [Oscillospiraceae bacterium]
MKQKKKKKSYPEMEPEELDTTDETEEYEEDDQESKSSKPGLKGLFSKLLSSFVEEVEVDDDDDDDEDDDDEYEDESEEDEEETEPEYDDDYEEDEEPEDEPEQDFSQNFDITLDEDPELNLPEADEEEPPLPAFIFPDENKIENEEKPVVLLSEQQKPETAPEEAPDELLLNAPEDMPEFREEAVPGYQKPEETVSSITDSPEEEDFIRFDDDDETETVPDHEEDDTEEDDEEDEEELDSEGRPKRSPLAVAIPIAAVLVIALGFTYCLQLGLFSEKEVYYMPDLVGRNYYELGEDYNNFDIQVNRSEYSAYDKDIIYAQDIPAGTEVKLGQTVNIDLSLGYAVVQVPDVRNYQYAYAQKLLEQSGFETEIVYEQSLNGTAADNVIRTLPASGSDANEGSKITMYVSQGLAADSAQVQTFTGMLLNDAVDLCEMYGLEVETVPVPALEAENVVVEQSIEAGTSVPFHTVITLAYSSGEQPQGTVPYQLNFPPYATGRFILDFIDTQGNVLASSDIIVAGFSAASTVPMQGTGSQEIKVVLNNCTTNMQAELGTYNFDFTTGTYTVLNEDMQAAFEAVNGIS